MRILLAAAVLMLAGPAHAEVKATWDGGFRLENRATLSATREQTWFALAQIGRWWNSEHTYSGDARNMVISLKPGGCWCEVLPGGGIEHGRVILAWPEKGTLRLEAALGPLQDEGVSGALTWQINELKDGGVEVVQTYNVGGVRPEMVRNAALIDGVMAEQLGRLKGFIRPAP